MSLIEQYRAMMDQGHFKGLSVLKFADEIEKLCKGLGAETLLDYGAGQGHQYGGPYELAKRWGVDVTCYDPAVPGMDELPPGPFDVVICSDVLEHIPRDEIERLLHNVFSRADKHVFLTVCCRPAKKTFPDGANVHVTLMPMAEWEKIVADAAAVFGVKWTLRETP